MLRLLPLLWLAPALAWTSQPRRRRSSRLFQAEERDDLKERMKLVRSLQTTFYRSNPVEQQSFDLTTGTLYNLPLWRVEWYELPGRTNVLNVHDPVYTHAFESLLHTSNPPWYFGHLYLPGGSRSMKDPKMRLKTWDQSLEGKVDLRSRSSVLGTLLRISDYRRMEDGRLLLLVQAMERFVVTDVIQELPYGLAHVQLLPNTEEIEDSDWMLQRTEGDVHEARALALQESFSRWHRYEYENTVLPLPLKSDLPSDAVVGSVLAKVLPYASYSSIVNVARLRTEPLAVPPPQPSGKYRLPDYSHCTLEHRLLQGGILQDPVLEPAKKQLSLEDLEYNTWIALDIYLKKSRSAVSPVLLGLLPPNYRWPENFQLEKIADAIQDQILLDHKCVRVSPDYPVLRRQKRLSYSVASLMEDMDTVDYYRSELLMIPSTRLRLAYVLQQLEARIRDLQ